jgi:hypothetical protein
MINWKQLRKQLTLQMWPSGAPENLENRNPEFPDVPSPIEQLFQEGAADISKWVECERESNVDCVEFCKTFYRCGMTALRKPSGVIKRVFTICNDDFCDPVFYTQGDPDDPERWAHYLRRLLKPSAATEHLPMGFLPADASTDSSLGRARTGVWSIKEGNILLAPWIQSTEKVYVEWSGIKKFWKEEDLVLNEHQDYRKALRMYVQFAYERDYGSAEKAALYLIRRPGMADTGYYADALADLMWQCREETKTRDTGVVYPKLDAINLFTASTSGSTAGQKITGSVFIPSGVNTGTVTGLGLSAVPTNILLTVSVPQDGIAMSANPITDTITASQFDYVLSGLTNSGNFILTYEITL